MLEDSTGQEVATEEQVESRHVQRCNAPEATVQPPDKGVLLLHERLQLHKAESSIFTQICTGRTGLADFLHLIGYWKWPAQRAPRGFERETVQHTTGFCPRYQDIMRSHFSLTARWLSGDYSQRKGKWPGPRIMIDKEGHPRIKS
jgi:hypothetical protein